MIIHLKSRLGLFITFGCIVTLSLILFAGNEEKAFKDMSKEDKVKFLEDQTTRYKNDTTELVKYFEANWDGESSEVKANFCKLMKEYRAIIAIPLLVKRLDFFDVSGAGDRKRPLPEIYPAIGALAQIGMPAIKSASEWIYTEFNNLTDFDSISTKHRLGFLKSALKYLLQESLGAKLSVVFLEDKINDKETPVKLKEILTSILDDIKKK